MLSITCSRNMRDDGPVSACSGWPSRCGSRASTRVPPSGRAVTTRSPPTESACSRMPRRPRCSGPISSPATIPRPSSSTRSTYSPGSSRSSTRTCVAPACLTTFARASRTIRISTRPTIGEGCARHLDVDLDRGRPGAERRPDDRAQRLPDVLACGRAADRARPAAAGAGRCLPAPTRRGRRARRPAPVAATAPASGAAICSRRFSAAITCTVSSWISPAIRCRSASWASCRCSSRPRWWATWRCIAARAATTSRRSDCTVASAIGARSPGR